MGKANNEQRVKQFSKNLQSYLSNKGIKIDVEHGRPTDLEVTYPNGTRDHIFSREEFSELMKDTPDGVTMQLRGHYTHNLLRIQNVTTYGSYVLPTGGFTKVTLTLPSGETLTGKYNFHNDPFFKAMGIINAIRSVLRGTNVLSGFNDFLGKVE